MVTEGWAAGAETAARRRARRGPSCARMRRLESRRQPRLAAPQIREGSNGSDTGDGAFAGAGDQFGVLGEYAGSVARIAGLPLGEAAGNFRRGKVEIEHAAFGVHRDHVAFGDYGDGAAVEGLGRHVGDHEAVGGSAEAAVRHAGDAIAQSGAHQCAGDAEHFAHTGSAARAFVADDHYVVSLNSASEPSRHGFLFALPYAGRSAMDLFAAPC